MTQRLLWAAAATIFLTNIMRAEIVVRDDGNMFEAKVLSLNDTQAVLIPDFCDASAQQSVPRTIAARVITTDEHGALLKDSAAPATAPADTLAPADPPAPPITAPPSGNSYYVIPLHGEVGETVLASALQKSLDDAIKRKPTVVVLDIDSPGGLVDEARQIITLLHKYNKKLRIVALANQDLSAAAISTLSVKEIYVKLSCTIGAATSYVPGNLMLPPKLEEKMQSVWRAELRNSAEGGGHEPMLADAMIDTDQELHWETVNGKPVVKDGPGDHMICKKGKILTLSSHEAVDCGLAAGEADDFDELGDALKMGKWTEIKGLAGPLADSLTKRLETYQTEMKKIEDKFVQDVGVAEKADPSQSVTTVTRVLTVPTGPTGQQIPGRPQYYPRQPNVPGAPGYVPGAPVMPGYVRAGQVPTQRIVTQTQGRPTSLWKHDSLACVVALQQSEGDLKDAIALADAYGRTSEADMLKDFLDKMSTIRAAVYDNRDKYTHEIFPNGALETGQAGSTTGNGFVTTNRGGLPVIGFNYRVVNAGTKQFVAGFDPIYVRPAVDSQPNIATQVMAKDGYVVGGLIVDANAANVLAIKVKFVGYKNGVIVPTDTYLSDWIGQSDDQTPKSVAGEGETVLGTCGKKIGNLVAIGLVVREPDVKK